MVKTTETSKAKSSRAKLETELATTRERLAYAENVLRYALCVLGTAKAAERYFARYERKETK